MRTIFSFIVWAIASTLLQAQSGFAETYDATTGFDAKFLVNTTYGFKVFTDKTTPAPNTFTRMTFETGADGTFWGVAATTDYS